MSASYPTSAKIFSTKSNGQTIAASHVDDLQDEVAAIESGLLNGIAHALKPSAAGAQDLGTTSVPWGNGYFTGLPMDIGLCEGRLTLTSGTPITTGDVTAATSIYFTPYRGNRLALFDGSNWALYTFTELTLALGTLTSGKPYDVFVYNNSGTLTLESLVWTNDTTRATALTTQNGVLVKSGATTRRYLGTFYTTSTTTTEDSAAKRFLWNYYNRIRRPLTRYETTSSWNYTTATVRQANGSTANQVDTVVGVAEALLDLTLNVVIQNTNASVLVSAGIGVGSTTSYAAGTFTSQPAAGVGQPELVARLATMPAVGRQFYSWNEWSTATGTTTWYAQVGGIGSTLTAGLSGWIEG